MILEQTDVMVKTAILLKIFFVIRQIVKQLHLTMLLMNFNMHLCLFVLWDFFVYVICCL